MKLTHEEKRTPTFRQWCKLPGLELGTKYEVERIFCNDEWRTVTFVTSEFRINFKYTSAKEYASTYSGVKKVVTKHCRVFIEHTDTEKASISIELASDADESPQKFDEDDLGFLPSAKS